LGVPGVAEGAASGVRSKSRAESAIWRWCGEKPTTRKALVVATRNYWVGLGSPLELVVAARLIEERGAGD